MAIIKTLCCGTSSDYASLRARDLSSTSSPASASSTLQASASSITMSTPPPIDFIIVIAVIICMVECISMLRRWLTIRRIRSRTMQTFESKTYKYRIPQVTYTDYSSSEEDDLEGAYYDEKRHGQWRGETDGDDDDELNWSVV